jgi:hypothetical protein
MIFACATCGLEITKEVEELPDHGVLTDVDGEPHVPAGFFYVAPGIDVIRPANDFILNLADLRNTRHHHDRSRLHGCCGIAGTDGFTTVCPLGHEIGTEHSDCWFSHFIVLPASRVVPISRCGKEF